MEQADSRRRRADYMRQYMASMPPEKKAKYVAKKAEYYKAKREYLLAKRRLRAITHKEKLADYQRLYRFTESGKAARANAEHKRRAQKKNCHAPATTQQVKNLLSISKRCAYCGVKFCAKNPATLEHIIPLSKGGSHSRDNLAAACQKCNTSKSAKDPIEYARTHGLLLV